MFKNGILCWKYCPSCDGKLVEPVGIGDEWECSECGETGIRNPHKYDVTFKQWQHRKLWEVHEVPLYPDGIAEATRPACEF